MKRTMLQLNLKDCDKAIELYTQAFDAVVDAVYRDPHDNTVAHAEITAFGQCISFSEQDTEIISGNTMQFCFHLGEGNEAAVKKAYEVLKDGAEIEFPLGALEYSTCIFGLTDKFGVNWCLFV